MTVSEDHVWTGKITPNGKLDSKIYSFITTEKTKGKSLREEDGVGVMKDKDLERENKITRGFFVVSFFLL